ncbi:hypothetical protein DFP72DRAFT_904284, partial [Ephemerocybe angulata]
MSGHVDERSSTSRNLKRERSFDETTPRKHAKVSIPAPSMVQERHESILKWQAEQPRLPTASLETLVERLPDQLAERDTTIARLARSLERREEEIDMKDARISTLSRQLEEVVAQRDVKDAENRELKRRLEEMVRNSSASDPYGLPGDYGAMYTPGPFWPPQAPANSYLPFQDTHTTEVVALKRDYEQRLASLNERLSECYAQLVAARSQAVPAFTSTIGLASYDMTSNPFNRYVVIKPPGSETNSSRHTTP